MYVYSCSPTADPDCRHVTSDILLALATALQKAELGIPSSLPCHGGDPSGLLRPTPCLSQGSDLLPESAQS